MSKRRKRFALHAGLFISIAFLCGCNSTSDLAEENGAATAVDSSELYSGSLEGPLRPLPQDVALDERKITLGKLLFHDTRLSRDDSISCASCHDLKKGGTDQMARSVGVDGAVGGVNAPTVLNSGLNFMQFWDGRAPKLEDQVSGPIHNPLEMGSNWSQVIDKLTKDAELTAAFKEIYNSPPTAKNIRDAIATYERALITPNSPFDRYLLGDEQALTVDAEKGYDLFVSLGCVSCHQGTNIGGNMFQRLGIMNDYFGDRGNITEADYGRYNVTNRESDKFKFKVPSLRNVALTAPYFHDGSAADLQTAVEMMIHYQLGQTATEQEVAQLVAFLESLTGELDEKLQ